MNILNRFPPIPLRESEDGLVEDFHHYASRMREVLLIGRQELANILRGKGPTEKTTYGQCHSSWIGPAGSYMELVRPMQEFAGQLALTRGTFYRVANVIGRGGTATRYRNSVRRHWCPVCYADWDDDCSFEPLLWSSALLSRCPTHGALMRSTCPICHCQQSPGVEYRKRRFCNRCKSPLFTDPAYRPPSKFQEWIDERLANYFKFVCADEAQIPASALSNFMDVSSIVLQKPGGLKRFEIPRKSSKPTIKMCLNYCAILGCEVEDLFLQQSSESTLALFTSRPPFVDLPFRRRVIHHRMVFFEECLLELYDASDGYLLPYFMVASEFELAPGAIRETCRATVDRYSRKFALQSGLRR